MTSPEEIEPLIFEPILKSKVWGGRNLSSSLGKTLPSQGPYGESWELADLPEAESKIKSGSFAGKTLRDLIEDKQLFNQWGSNVHLSHDGRFPLLIKFLDAQQDLSLQVHPDQEVCKKLGDNARPKTEAWYIIDAAPDAKLYLGVKAGTSKERFSQAITNNNLEAHIVSVPVKAGDFYFIPSGTLHAIGAGIVLAEVQQTSDTTYRVHDWGRMGLDGKLRQLHVEQALTSINFKINGPVDAKKPPSGRPGIDCSEFTMELLAAQSTDLIKNKLAIAMVTKGNAILKWATKEIDCRLGTTLLLPVSKHGWILESNNAECLIITFGGLV